MNKYLPSLPQITQNVIAVAIATVVFAWVVSQSPRLAALVRDYQAPSL